MGSIKRSKMHKVLKRGDKWSPMRTSFTRARLTETPMIVKVTIRSRWLCLCSWCFFMLLWWFALAVDFVCQSREKDLELWKWEMRSKMLDPPWHLTIKQNEVRRFSIIFLSFFSGFVECERMQKFSKHFNGAYRRRVYALWLFCFYVNLDLSTPSKSLRSHHVSISRSLNSQ